jgi:PAS domain S-box-containing protein
MNGSATSSNDLYFLQGGGEMGALMRAKDWSATSLGPPHEWPQSLRTMIAVLLENPFGMYIAWGPEYLAFYNDGYRPILGSMLHPKALGAPTSDTFADIWPEVGPMYAEVMRGLPRRLFDYELVLHRNGYAETCYFDLAYSPIRNEDGTVGGILATVVETTEKTTAVNALKESENRFRNMAEASDILIATSDATSNATYFNKAWTALTGRPVEELLNFGWADLIHAADRQAFVDHYLDSFAQRIDWTGQFRMLNKNGEYRWLLAKGVGRNHADGSFAGYTSSSMDITNQVLALNKIEASELDLRTTVMAAPIGICVMDAATLVSEIVNDSFLEVAGKPYEAIMGKHYWDSFAEARPYYEAALAKVVQEGIAYFANEVELMLIRHGQEEIIYVTFVYSPLKNAEGEVKKVAVWVLENTTQVNARRRIQEAEERARLAINSADLGLYEIVYDSNVMTTDQRFREIWGMDHDSNRRDEYAATIHPDDQAMRMRAHEQSLQTGNLHYQTRLIQPDGSIHWARITGKVLYEGDKPLKIIGVAQDITASVEAKHKIEASEKSLRTMILQSPVAMCIFRGPHYVVDIANHKMLELWGKRPEDVLQHPIFEGLPEARDQGLEQILQDVVTTGERFEANEMPVSLPRNGKIEIVYINFSYEALQAANSQISGILAVAIDVTDQVIARHQIEAVVTERTKALADANNNLEKSNAELAQFAYIASHDLQEPTRKISVFTDMLAQSLGEEMNASTLSYLNKINESSARMNRLIKDILTYSKLDKEQELFEPVDLNGVINNGLEDYDLLIAQKGAIVDIGDLPVIEAISIQMSQLFGNLLGNALKFIRKDVPPVISIRAFLLTTADREALGLRADLQYHHIRFADNGIGLKPEHATQIFEIFKRLHRKSAYEGTGIGLALCKKIALNHQGDITATGSSEAGAVINVYLPVRQ